MDNQSLITIDGMPEISSLLSSCLSEIRISGLLASMLVEAPRRDLFLEHVFKRLESFSALFQSVDGIVGRNVKLNQMPILYNSQMWSAGNVLGGYWGIDANLSLNEMLVSYVAFWKYQALQGAYSRLVKAVLAYVGSGKSFVDGFKYLIDLFEAGYIINAGELINAGSMLLEYYAKTSDPVDTLKTFTLNKNPETTETVLRSLREISQNKKAVDEQRVREILGYVLTRVYDMKNEAKDITSLAQYLLISARIYGPIQLLMAIYHAYKGLMKFGITNEALLSKPEEWHADIFANSRGVMRNPRHLPLSEMTSLTVIPPFLMYAFLILIPYKEKFGRDAVEKLYEDRLVPEYLREILKALSGETNITNAVKNSNWPDSWMHLPITFAFPIACIKDFNPLIMRTEILPKEDLIKQIRETTSGLRLSDKEIDRLVDEAHTKTIANSSVERASVKAEKAKRVSQTELNSNELLDFYDIYIQVCAKDLQARFMALGKDADSADEERLKYRKSQFIELMRLYPWFPAAHQEMAIINDRLSDSEGARSYIQSALLLDIENKLVWQSFRAICSRYSTKQDLLFARAVTEALSLGRSG